MGTVSRREGAGRWSEGRGGAPAGSLGKAALGDGSREAGEGAPRRHGRQPPGRAAWGHHGTPCTVPRPWPRSPCPRQAWPVRATGNLQGVRLLPPRQAAGEKHSGDRGWPRPPSSGLPARDCGPHGTQSRVQVASAAGPASTCALTKLQGHTAGQTRGCWRGGAAGRLVSWLHLAADVPRARSSRQHLSAGPCSPLLWSRPSTVPWGMIRFPSAGLRVELSCPALGRQV